MREILEREGLSIRGEEDFFSVARTTPFVARQITIVSYTDLQGSRFLKVAPLMPRAVTPWFTAFKAYSAIISATENQITSPESNTNLDQLSTTDDR